MESRKLTKKELATSVAKSLIGYNLDYINGDKKVVAHYHVTDIIDGYEDEDGIRDYEFRMTDETYTLWTIELSQQQVYEILESGSTMTDDEFTLVDIDIN